MRLLIKQLVKEISLPKVKVTFYNPMMRLVTQSSNSFDLKVRRCFHVTHVKGMFSSFLAYATVTFMLLFLFVKLE